MSGAKKVGGIIAIICGMLLLVQTIMNTDIYWTFAAYGIVINLLIAGFAIIGGVFGAKGQQGPGFLALIAAVLSIVLGIVFVSGGAVNFNLLQYSFFMETVHIGNPNVNLFMGISLEAILIAIGGLVIVASGSD